MRSVTIRAVVFFAGLSCAFGALDARAAGGKKPRKGGQETKGDGDSGSGGGGSGSGRTGGGAQFYRGAYGMAGCGWGGTAVGNNPSRSAQMVAYIGNGFCTNQSTALSFGTSNCDKAPPDLARMEQEVFVTSNLASLSREAAQGDGEHLAAFAELLGCSDDFAAFAARSRATSRTVFDTSEATEVLRRIKAALSAAPEINCRRA